MTQVYLALYKGRKRGKSPRELWQRLTDWAVRTTTGGQYSHCEIAVKHGFAEDYHCYSASLRDGGVRAKTMPLPADKWDLIPIRDAEAHDKVWALYQQRWFCSEGCARALGLGQPEKYSPSRLARRVAGSILSVAEYAGEESPKK